MKNTHNKFFVYLRSYLTIFLPKQRNYSQHTIAATQQVWGMLLPYICKRAEKRIDNLTFADFSYETVSEFLNDMEASKNWKPATRNHRLARIRSFFHYAAGLDPLLSVYLADLRKIRLKKGADKSFVLDFMEPTEVSAILHQPNTSTKMGIRDMFFMTLMFDSAARNCEMLTMRICDFKVKEKVVYLIGKGNKPRCVPISDTTVQHFQQYVKRYHSSGDETSLIFYTLRHGEKTPMSDDNVARFIRKYSTQARRINPKIPEKVHPHMFRKSRAMSLYRSGMPLPLVSEWLGHNDPETTLIYARADTEMKRKAIEKADALAGTPTLPEATNGIWNGDDSIIRQLLGLEAK